MSRDCKKDALNVPTLHELVYLDIDAEKPIKIIQKVLIPNFRNPTINYVGRIIGPKGICVKKLAEEFKCNVQVLGRGSMSDKVLEEAMLKSGDPNHAHLVEQLHVKIETIATPCLAFRRISDLLNRLSIVFNSAAPYKQASEVKTLSNNYQNPAKKNDVALSFGVEMYDSLFSKPPPAIIQHPTIPTAKLSFTKPADFSSFVAPPNTVRIESMLNPTLKKSSNPIKLGKDAYKILNGLNETFNASQVCMPGHMTFHAINSRPPINLIPTADPQQAINLASTFALSKSRMQSDPNGNMATPSRSRAYPEIQKRKRTLEFDTEDEESSPAKKLASITTKIASKSIFKGSTPRGILNSTLVKENPF